MSPAKSGLTGTEPAGREETRQGWREPERVRALALVVIAVWAVGASGAFAWHALDAGSLRQTRLWTSQAIVLLAQRDGLSAANEATQHLLATGSLGFAEDGVSALRGNGLLLMQLVGAPESGTAEALNLNSTSALCIAIGYETLEQMTAGDPSLVNDSGFRQYANIMAHGLGTLAGFLPVRPDGTDPLTQMGPANVTVVRQDVTVLASFYVPPSSGC